MNIILLNLWNEARWTENPGKKDKGRRNKIHRLRWGFSLPLRMEIWVDAGVFLCLHLSNFNSANSHMCAGLKTDLENTSLDIVGKDVFGLKHQIWLSLWI